MKKSSSINEYHLHLKAPGKRQFDLYDLREYLAKNNLKSSKPHSHSYYQLIWFYDNGGEHFIDFKSYAVKRDSLFFIAKGQIHFFDERTNYEGVLLHFNEPFLLQNSKDIAFFLNYRLFNDSESPFFQIPAHLLEELTTYIKQIKHELNNRHTFGHEAILSNTVKSLLIRVEREKRKQTGTYLPNSNSIALTKFRKLLEANYRKNWTVSAYARELNVSTKTLNNLVKSATGKTSSTMICNRIILEAKRRLSHSDDQVNEIGYYLVFKDASYFVKYFKKHVFLTPSEYRRLIS